MSAFNLPPGCTLRDIDPPRLCAGCDERIDPDQDSDYCALCEQDRRDSLPDDSEQHAKLSAETLRRYHAD